MQLFSIVYSSVVEVAVECCSGLLGATFFPDTTASSELWMDVCCAVDCWLLVCAK
jgi:hypothetical protein